MLTDKELSQIQSDIQAELLPDTAEVKRPGSSVDVYGNVDETAVTVATVACRLDPIEGRADTTGMVAAAEAMRTWYRLTLPHNTDIEPGDHVVINSTTYEVVQLHDDHSERVSVRAMVARIE